MDVEFLARADIESRAQAVLADYERRFGSFDIPVVPVDEILESLLGLTLRFDEVKERWGSATLAATMLADRTVLVDVSLEPDTHPDQEATYRFTLAHEIGHWALHRGLAAEPGARLAHAPTAESVPTWGAVRKTAYDRIEHQANRFAEALLMPEPWLRERWRQATGGDAPLDMTDELEELKENSDFGPAWEPAVAVSRALAPLFRVSGFAMQIRLKHVGLLAASAGRAATA